MKGPVFIYLFLGLLSCNSESGGSAPEGSTVHTTAEPNVVTDGEPFVLAGCYQMTIKQDTADLQLDVSDTIVTGKLRYDWHEKDGSTGTLKGVFRDSLIRADYTFQSEGLTSVQEVVFKIDRGNLLQAFGQSEEKEGRVVFRSLDSLQYDNTHPFVKIMCP